MYNFITHLRYIYGQKMLFLVCVLFGNQVMISMDTTNVVFSKEFLELSKTVKSMVSDIGESDQIIIPLKASGETMKDVFSIFRLYNDGGVASGSIRREIESYGLHRLVGAANLLQDLDLFDHDIINAVMNQIAYILGNILDLSLKSLYQSSQALVVPNYEALKDLNFDVERMIKKNFQIQHVLQWRIQDLWKFVRRDNFAQQIEQFKQGDETIASFLDRNVVDVMKKFNEEKKQINSSNDLPTSDTSVKSNNNQNIVLGAAIAAAAIAGLWKLYEYIKQQQQ